MTKNVSQWISFCVTISISQCINLFFVAVNKQLNDKERVAAALENPNLLDMVEECLSPTFDWGPDISGRHGVNVQNPHKLMAPWSLFLSFENWDALGCCRTCGWILFRRPFQLLYCYLFTGRFWCLWPPWAKGKWCNQVLCCSFRSVVSATVFCGCIPTQSTELRRRIPESSSISCLSFFICKCLLSDSMAIVCVKKPWFLLEFRFSGSTDHILILWF